MQVKQKNHSVDSLFSFLLLLTFCLFALMLAGMGSAIYRNGAASLDENYTSRTAIAYVSEKVRQHDQAGDVFLTSVDGLDALALRDQIEDEPFLTYIYFYDGALRELFIRESRAPEAEMGSRIVELSSFAIEPVLTDGAQSGRTPSGESSGSVELLSATAVSEKGNRLSALIHLSSH